MAFYKCNFISYTLGRAVDICVTVPSPPLPGAICGKRTHQHKAPYPVLYLLHGGGNDCHSWFLYTQLRYFAEVRNIAVVTMSAENGRYADHPGHGPKYFTFIEKELPEFISAYFPVSAKAKDTYIAGLSQGGAGAWAQVLDHPERYAAFGMLSSSAVGPMGSGCSLSLEGFYHVDKADDLFNAADMPKIPDDGKPVDFSKFRFPVKYKPVHPDALKRLEEIKRAGLRFPKAYIGIGGYDGGFLGAMTTAVKLNAMGFEATFEGVSGYAHEWAYWNIGIERFLDWLPRTDTYYRESPKRRF